MGHGRSEGEKVQISSFKIYAADVLKHIDEASANNGGLPIFLFGHSMASFCFNSYIYLFIYFYNEQLVWTVKNY